MYYKFEERNCCPQCGGALSHVGSINTLEMFECIDNRLAVNQSLQTKYVRFVFEFPDEFEARTDSEWETFNGKFLVFQIPIEQREVE